jgi:hypothetical protein
MWMAEPGQDWMGRKSAFRQDPIRQLFLQKENFLSV